MSLTIIDNINIFQKDVIGNVRSSQEDSHDIAALTPNGDVFVVCDGMGGHVGGKQASSIAVKCILEYLKKEKYPNPIQALNDALQFANMQILGYANEHPELKGMGTTACILLLQDTEAYIAHVGDSRIYLFLGKEKQLHRITKDHSFVQTLVDAGQITDEEAEHHPNKNRILKALGINPDLAPTFNQIKPKNGDIFLICSDGLSGMITDSTIKDNLCKNTQIKDKGETLINLALEAGGVDNITLELIHIVNSPHLKSAFKSYNPVITKNGSAGKSKIFNLLAITALAVSICIIICCWGYNMLNSKIYDKNFKTLNEQIKTDSVNLLQAEEAYKLDSINLDLSKSKRESAFKEWKKNKTDATKKAYDLAAQATEAQKSQIELKLKNIEIIRKSLDIKRKEREVLITKILKNEGHHNR